MDEFTELLAELIRMKSVTADVEAVNRVSARIESFLKNKGLYCIVEQIDGRNVLYASTVPGKKTEYLMNAHMDVVPADPHQFEPKIRDGRMYARGSDDCLGCCIVLIRTLIALKDKASCGVIFSADEEVGGITTEAMIKRGYSASKACVLVDADYAAIAIAQKGVLEVILKAESATGGGHASEPWVFDNPIDKLIDGYVKLRNCWKNPVPENQWSDSMTPCIVKAGMAYNQIPDQASMTLNIRFTEPDGQVAIVEKIREITGLTVETGSLCPPMVTNADSPEIGRLRDIMQREMGRDIPIVRLNGATDARYLVELGLPVAILGVDGEGCHSHCEWVNLDSLELLSRVLVEFIAGK